MTTSNIAIARLRRPPPILLCRKCLKRADAGKQIKRALKAELKSRRAHTGRKPPRLVMTSCFGICPKRAVVAASGAMLERSEVLLLADAGQATEAVERLTSVESAGTADSPVIP